MSKANKIALITGAGRTLGIGYETAAQLAAQGFKVILTARDGKVAEARAKELADKGLDVVACALDVTDESSVSNTVSQIERDYGHLDVLINNAAIIGAMDEHAVGADLNAAHQLIEANLFGPWRLTQALLPLLRKSEHPRIVNVSSGAGSHGDPAFGLTTGVMNTPYAVSKAALNALTVQFAIEEKSNRVLVNAVCPGFTATFEGAEQMGARPVKEGAASIVWGALIPDSGPTGGFFRDGKALPW